MTDEVTDTETEEQRKARIAALPRPTASLSMFRLSGVGDQVGGSQIILGGQGDKVTLGITTGQTVGDDTTTQKIAIGSITVSVKRDVRSHTFTKLVKGPEKRTSETKEHTIVPGADKMFGPIREQVTIEPDPFGGGTYIDDENIYITLVSVQDAEGKAVDQDKSDPPPPPPKSEDFPWWIVGVGVTLAVIVVIGIYLWKRGTPAVTAPPATAPAPAPAAPVNVTVVK